MNYALSDEQTLSFALSFLLGAFLCLIYDLVRVLHKIAVKGFAEVFITDILFSFFCAVLTFCFMIIFCGGYVRGYVLFGEAVGFFVFRLTASRVLMPLFLKAALHIASVFKFTSEMISAISDKAVKIFIKCQKAFKKYLKLGVMLLYNCKPKKRKELLSDDER